MCYICINHTSKTSWDCWQWRRTKGLKQSTHTHTTWHSGGPAAGPVCWVVDKLMWPSLSRHGLHHFHLCVSRCFIKGREKTKRTKIEPARLSGGTVCLFAMTAGKRASNKSTDALDRNRTGCFELLLVTLLNCPFSAGSGPPNELKLWWSFNQKVLLIHFSSVIHPFLLSSDGI